MGPKNLQTTDVATPAAKDGKKPLALLFLVDDELRSYTLLRLLSDPGVGDALEKVIWAKVPWSRDDEQAKLYKIAAPGAIVLLDPTVDPPKPLKTLRGVAPPSMRKELTEAAKLVK